MLAGRSTGLRRIFDEPLSTPPEDELAQAYRDDAAQRGLVVEMATSFFDMAVKMPTPKRPLDLVRFAFQRELYDTAAETDKRLDVEKAAQLGVSEWLVRLALRLADKGFTVIYIMPKLAQATEFSDRRVKPVMESSDYLRARLDRRSSPSTDNKGLKSIGDGWLAIRGSKSRDALHEVDADAVIMDEYDRLEQANLPELEQRGSSAFSPGLLRAVSTPTYPNYGIDRRIKETDERYWFVRCGGRNRKGKRAAGCGEWTPMKGRETFDYVLDQDAALLLCPECGQPLDVREGEWVATFTDGDRPRGYHMSKFVVPGIDLAGIVERSTRTSERGRRAFFNQDLGEAWQAEGAGLNDEQIAAATRDYALSPDGYFAFNPVTMGIDVAADAKGMHVRVSEHLDEHRKKALWVGIVRDGHAPWGGTSLTAFEILAEMMDRFRVTMAVIDHMPEPRTVRAWCERFRGRAFRVQWFDKLTAVLTRPNAKGDPTKLHARYLEGLDSTLDLIRRQANLLPPEGERPADYAAHLKARVLATVEPDVEGLTVTDQEKAGSVKSSDAEIRQAWLKTGPDDFLQAEAYDVIATEMLEVARTAGGLAAATNTIAPSHDLVDRIAQWQDPNDDDVEYPEDDLGAEPLGGW